MKETKENLGFAHKFVGVFYCVISFIAYLCIWMYECQRTNSIHNFIYLFFTICAVNVASATTLSPTNI